jgi:hypothetical protein
MSKPGLYQVHIFLREDFARAAARKEKAPGMEALAEVLARHNAELAHSRLEEFTRFVEKIERLPEGKESSDFVSKLYAMTKTALANPEKRDLFAREYTVEMNGKLMFSGDAADALIADLKKLGDSGILTSGKAAIPGKPLHDVPPVRKTYLPRHHPGTK